MNPIYPLDLVEQTIKKFTVELNQTYINQVVNYFNRTQDINLTIDFYYNLLKESKVYFKESEIDKTTFISDFCSWVNMIFTSF